MIAITSVVNALDGQSVVVTLASAPVGQLIINYTRNVGGVGNGGTNGSIDPTLVSGTSYKAMIGNLLQLGTPLPFQVSATDDTGTTPLVPVWVRYGTNSPFPLEIQTALQTILAAYQPHLNLYLAQVASAQQGMTVQKIVTGTPDSVQSYPIIAIDCSSTNSDWYALPITRQVNVTAHISCGFVHNTKISYRDHMKVLGQSIMDVLNQSQFTEINLPSSVQLVDCACTQMDVEEYQQDDKWVASATIAWGAYASWPEG